MVSVLVQKTFGSDGTLGDSLGERGVRPGRCDLWRRTWFLRISRCCLANWMSLIELLDSISRVVRAVIYTWILIS
jgi:hypothetical protein